MEFNDLDNPFKQSKPSTSRFAPKSSRFQPKTKQTPVKPEPKPELVPTPERVNVKEEDSHTISSVGDAKMGIDEDFSAKNGGITIELKEEEEAGVPESSVAIEEDDVVVAEYDVYFNPPDPSSQVSQEIEFIGFKKMCFEWNLILIRVCFMLVVCIAISTTTIMASLRLGAKMHRGILITLLSFLLLLIF
jgi:hypothetical protein